VEANSWPEPYPSAAGEPGNSPTGFQLRPWLVLSLIDPFGSAKYKRSSRGHASRPGEPGELLHVSPPSRDRKRSRAVAPMSIRGLSYKSGARCHACRVLMRPAVVPDRVAVIAYAGPSTLLGDTSRGLRDIRTPENLWGNGASSGVQADRGRLNLPVDRDRGDPPGSRSGGISNRQGKFAFVTSLAGSGSRYPRGPYMMTATPTRQMAALVKSNRSGLKSSKIMPQAREPTTKTPP